MARSRDWHPRYHGQSHRAGGADPIKAAGLLLDQKEFTNAADVTFSDIPQTSTHLELVWVLGNSIAGGGRIDMRLRDSAGNNIGSGNIDSYLVQLNGAGTRTDTYVPSATSNYRTGHVGGSRRSFGRILIPRYSDAGIKGFTGSGVSYGTTGGNFSNWQSGGVTSAGGTIHFIDIVQIGGTFNGRIWLYGND